MNDIDIKPWYKDCRSWPLHVKHYDGETPPWSGPFRWTMHEAEKVLAKLPSAMFGPSGWLSGTSADAQLPVALFLHPVAPDGRGIHATQNRGRFRTCSYPDSQVVASHRIILSYCDFLVYWASNRWMPRALTDWNSCVSSSSCDIGVLMKNGFWVCRHLNRERWREPFDL
jgi:hypothetical protein